MLPTALDSIQQPSNPETLLNPELHVVETFTLQLAVLPQPPLTDEEGPVA